MRVFSGRPPDVKRYLGVRACPDRARDEASVVDGGTAPAGHRSPVRLRGDSAEGLRQGVVAVTLGALGEGPVHARLVFQLAKYCDLAARRKPVSHGRHPVAVQGCHPLRFAVCTRTVHWDFLRTRYQIFTKVLNMRWNADRGGAARPLGFKSRKAGGRRGPDAPPPCGGTCGGAGRCQDGNRKVAYCLNRFFISICGRRRNT